METCYTVKEVAKILKRSVTTIYKYIKTGQLQAVKINSQSYLVKESQIAKFLEG